MAQTITVIVLIVIAGLILWAYVAANQKQRARNQEDNVYATLNLPLNGSLSLTATELIEGYLSNAVRHPRAGLVAHVEDAGSLQSRVTATRLAAFGIFALAVPKKTDQRELFLTIEGPDTAILRRISLKNRPSIGENARRFAMAVNTKSKTVA